MKEVKYASYIILTMLIMILLLGYVIVEQDQRIDGLTAYNLNLSKQVIDKDIIIDELRAQEDARQAIYTAEDFLPLPTLNGMKMPEDK
jgi:hypothetical protein